jgi:hypothetical protein
MKNISRKFIHSLEQLLVNVFPPKVYRQIGFIYELFRSRKSYSQYGEDLIVSAYFQSIGVEKGTYVDIGGYHPVGIFNTCLLHKSGWTGTAFDIDEFKLQAFRSIRGNKCKTQLGAVTNQKSISSESVPVYKFRRIWSEIDTLSLEAAETMALQRGIAFDTREVPLLNVKDVFARLGQVDFININIEGLDELVLLDIDLDIAKPSVIVLEDNIHFGGSNKIKKFLGEHGFELLFKSGGSVGYHKTLRES